MSIPRLEDFRFDSEWEAVCGYQFEHLFRDTTEVLDGVVSSNQAQSKELCRVMRNVLDDWKYIESWEGKALYMLLVVRMLEAALTFGVFFRLTRAFRDRSRDVGGATYWEDWNGYEKRPLPKNLPELEELFQWSRSCALEAFAKSNRLPKGFTNLYQRLAEQIQHLEPVARRTPCPS